MRNELQDLVDEFFEPRADSSARLLAIIDALLAWVPDLVGNVGPTSARIVSRWLQRHEGTLRDVLVSLISSWARQKIASKSLQFESYFDSWVDENRPEVLKKLLALSFAIQFAHGLDVGAEKKLFELVRQLRVLHESATAVDTLLAGQHPDVLQIVPEFTSLGNLLPQLVSNLEAIFVAIPEGRRRSRYSQMLWIAEI